MEVSSVIVIVHVRRMLHESNDPDEMPTKAVRAYIHSAVVGEVVCTVAEV
jgi:hypothetical protein